MVCSPPAPLRLVKEAHQLHKRGYYLKLPYPFLLICVSKGHLLSSHSPSRPNGHPDARGRKSLVHSPCALLKYSYPLPIKAYKAARFQLAQGHP